MVIRNDFHHKENEHCSIFKKKYFAFPLIQQELDVENSHTQCSGYLLTAQKINK